LIRRIFVAAVLLAPVVAQTPNPAIPKDHPPLTPSNRLEEAARLTAAVAGEASGKVGRVPHRNFIDEHIFGKMDRDGIPHAPLASDEEFLRRIHLDLVGRIPDSDALDSFLSDGDPAKRDRMIDKLIGSDAYLNKWSAWWLDLSRSVGGIVGTQGRNLYYDYIYDALQYNRGFHEIATELITAKAFSNWYSAPATYLVRSRILAPVNTDVMHEDSADEMTVTVFKHFLGVNLHCISCHDGKGHLEKINVYLTGKTRKEFWAQAAFFGNARVFRRTNVNAGRDEYGIAEDGKGYDAGAESVVRIKRNGNGPVEPAFILTGETPDPGKPLREELARMITSHPQFARATANLFWTEMMGVGLVDPVYDFDLARLDPRHPPPAPHMLQTEHAELLDALAADFRKSGFDLRHLFRTIARSSAYQLSSRFSGQWKGTYAKYFARKFVRRLSAEQLYDSLVVATDRHTDIPIKESHRKAKFLTEIRDPEDINTNRNLKDIHFFAETFGQANRRSTDRSTDSSVTQAVVLLNSPFVRDNVKAEPGSYLGRLLGSEKWSDSQLVDKLFRRFLLRLPTQEEKQVALELLSAKGQRTGGEDLQWGLLNKVEFIFNN
jgi:hypothetical protein